MSARRPSLKPAIIDLLAEGGLTDREIAERVGCDRSNVTKVRIELGLVAVAPRRGVIDAEWVDAALGQSVTRREIARYFGVTTHAVSMHLSRRRERAGRVSPAGQSDLGPLTHSSPNTETEPCRAAPLTGSV